MSRDSSIKYLSQLKDSMFKISKSVHDYDDINQLYKVIHESIVDLVHSDNFYISIYHKESNTISFPYYIDLVDSVPMESINMGEGLTSLIINTSKPLLINKKEYQELISSNKNIKQGTAPESWLGVPLISHGNESIGALVIQSYNKNIIFNNNDMEILTFVSEQIALAIEKFNTIDKIEKSLKYDELTGLPNKSFFFDVASSILKKANESKTSVAFVLVDLDDFMLIIDTYGYDFGNRIIEILSKRLSKLIDNKGIVSYWGGDKFNIILDCNLSPKKIKSIIQQISEKIRETVNIENQKFDIQSSIGVSIHPNDSINLNQLLRNSEIAMNYVKNNGKNNFKFYKHEIKQSLMKQFGIEVGLRKAISDSQWQIHYQPKYDISKHVYGCEALVRWDHPEEGIISPDNFIHIAEKSNQIHDISKYVLREVCKQTREWVNSGHEDFISSINLSSKELSDENIVKHIKLGLDESELNPRNLEIELTERIMINNPEKTIENLNKIKEIGVHLSIDDFGTGYSSFNYLGELPIDTIKIDRSFVNGIDKDSDKLKITKSIIGIGGKLNMNIVAEGVETKDEFDILEQNKCTKFQGYYFSKPLTYNQFCKIL